MEDAIRTTDVWLFIEAFDTSPTDKQDVSPQTSHMGRAPPRTPPSRALVATKLTEDVTLGGTRQEDGGRLNGPADLHECFLREAQWRRRGRRAGTSSPAAAFRVVFNTMTSVFS
ncbi:hypothetical protein LSAT2_010345 [Lamellibrachia satsuma]|nr:hypothetical protein LSAT2_010345 [Lamellibrachia satsuma]